MPFEDGPFKKPTRADIRRMEKEQKKASKTLNMSVASFESSLESARKEERKKMLDFAVSHYTASLCMVLHDKYGFGHDRLVKVMGQINDMYESLLIGSVTIADIRATIYEETGLLLK